MLKRLKQEFLFIPIMLLLIELLRGFLMSFYPETALYDRGSEIETFFVRTWQIAWISCACWLLIRIILPPAHKALCRFYDNFGTMPEDRQSNIALKVFLCIFFGLILLVSGRAATEPQMRSKLMDTLRTQLYVREATGHNDGPEVEKYLRFVGRYKGDAWCAAFASWNLNAVGVTAPPNPKSGWSPNFSLQPYQIWSHALEKARKVTTKPQPGDCFTLFYPSIGRVGHVGFIVQDAGDYYVTIEGNTGLTGSREGSGVHKYKRAKSKIYAITNYITPYLKKHEKTIVPVGHYRPVILQLSPAAGVLSSKGKRQYGNDSLFKGYDSIQGYHVDNKRRQLVADRCDHGGPGNQLAGDAAHYGEYTAPEAYRIREGWTSLYCLRLQGCGGQVTNGHAYNTGHGKAGQNTHLGYVRRQNGLRRSYT